MDRNQLVATRGFHPDDTNFIFASWLKGLRYGNEWFNLIEADTYYANYHKIIEVILETPGVAVTVSCLKEDPSVILGYSVHSTTCLHWVFVKKAWRGIGIAKSLVPPTVTTVSHITDAGRGILKKHPEVSFNPFTKP